jgi:hypothetical protein
MIMARKNRNLASFDDVANNNIKKNINSNDNYNVHENINENNHDNVNVNVNKHIKNNINVKEDANMNANANDDIQVNENNKINENENIQQDTAAGDYLDELIEGKVKKSEYETTLTGIYVRNDLLQVLNRLAKQGRRGAKSKVVNEALEKVFKEKGLI